MRNQNQNAKGRKTMAGYKGYSKSNNAVEAEANEQYPASVLAKKLKVPTAAVKAILRPCAWHHTSKMYNSTDYYDGSLLLILAAGIADTRDYSLEEIEELNHTKKQLASLRAWRAPKTRANKTWKGCRVDWLEWGGSRRNPKATERSAEHCTVEWNGGAFCVVTFSDGSTMRKKTSCRGFTVRDKENNRVWFQANPTK